MGKVTGCHETEVHRYKYHGERCDSIEPLRQKLLRGYILNYDNFDLYQVCGFGPIQVAPLKDTTLDELDTCVSTSAIFRMGYISLYVSNPVEAAVAINGQCGIRLGVASFIASNS